MGQQCNNIGNMGPKCNNTVLTVEAHRVHVGGIRVLLQAFRTAAQVTVPGCASRRVGPQCVAQPGPPDVPPPRVFRCPLWWYSKLIGGSRLVLAVMPLDPEKMLFLLVPYGCIIYLCTRIPKETTVGGAQSGKEPFSVQVARSSRLRPPLDKLGLQQTSKLIDAYMHVYMYTSISIYIYTYIYIYIYIFTATKVRMYIYILFFCFLTY